MLRITHIHLEHSDAIRSIRMFTNMQVTIDRFENDIAVIEIESGETMRVPRSELPEETAEGDVIELTFGINPAATDRRATGAKEVLNELLRANEDKD